jgi:hypothetical protein
LAFQFFATSSRAEPVSLGPFKPKLTLYGISIDAVATVSADIVTNRDGAYLRGDIFLLVDRDELSVALSALGNKLLPANIQKNPCTFEIQSIKLLTVSVISNTGDFHATVFVAPHGFACPLFSGDVSLGIRFVPAVAKQNLSLKISRLEVTVPPEWRFFGAAKAIEGEVRSRLEAFVFSMPTISHVTAAYQGASLDLKGNSFLIKIRSDAQVNQPAIMDVINKSYQSQNLSFGYP